MNYFYLKDIEIGQNHVAFEEEESKHISRVLRLKVGDFIAILNGKGVRFEAKIIENHPKRCQIEVTQHFMEDLPKNTLHVAISPTKNIDRFEWFLEKATEIGVDEVSPIIGDNSERKNLKMERLEKIAIAAMKQSQRLYLPVIHPIIKTSEFIKNTSFAYFAHCEEGNKNELHSFQLSGKTCIMIGPEGDFSKNEIALALKKGFSPVSLGKNRLRTETAGLYAAVVAKTRML